MFSKYSSRFCKYFAASIVFHFLLFVSVSYTISGSIAQYLLYPSAIIPAIIGADSEVPFAIWKNSFSSQIDAIFSQGA
jgi:hypothetical protein